MEAVGWKHQVSIWEVRVTKLADSLSTFLYASRFDVGPISSAAYSVMIALQFIASCF